MPNSEAKASALLASEQVDRRLLRAAHAFRGLLSLPLLVIRGSRYENRQHIWQFLPYTGENEPFPVDVPGRFEADPKVPYLALRSRLLSLSPGLVWKADPDTYQATFYFLDRLGEADCGFRSLLVDRMLDLDVDDSLDPVAWLRGDPQPTDSFEPSEDRSLRAVLFDSSSPDGIEEPTEQQVTHQDAGAPMARSDEASEGESPTSPARQTEHDRNLLVEGLRERAEGLQLGHQFGQLLDATASAGLAHQPFKHGVMVAPPTHRNRFLMWLKVVGNKTPYLKVTSGPSAFAEFFPHLHESRVTDALGADRRVYRGDSVDDLVEALAGLFPNSAPADDEAAMAGPDSAA